MITVDFKQGSPEWLAYRDKYLNASDSPAMMGVSKYESRDELIHRLATGINKEIDANTQKIFDDGHKYEALARPVAEKITGKEFYPVVGYEGDYSASFDGITMDEDINFEHKSLNDEIRTCFENGGSGVDLPLMYRVQMEHQFIVSGAKKCLFMASKWSNDGTLLEEHHCWYEPDLELRKKIISGWEQLKKDVIAYVPPMKVEKVEAETIKALPIPSVVVRGEITMSNLTEITPKFDEYLEGIKTELSTDQDFADAEANAKNCEDTEKRIEALRANIIAQMVDVNAVDSELGNYQEAFRKMKVLLKNAVKDQKDKIKTNAIFKAKNEYADFVTELNKGLTIMLSHKLVCPDFAGAIKSVKTIESMQSRINDALANGKAEATTLANDIKTKLAYINEAIKGYEHLFNINNFIFADIEYIKLQIQVTKEAEDKRKATHEAAIKANAEAEARAKIEAEQLAKEQTEEKAKFETERIEAMAFEASKLQKMSDVNVFLSNKPSADEIVEILANARNVEKPIAHKWLLETDFNALLKAA